LIDSKNDSLKSQESYKSQAAQKSQVSQLSRQLPFSLRDESDKAEFPVTFLF